MYRPVSLRLRKQQAKNFCTLLMLANGTPMFTAGDEFLHTQLGNNNPYNQRQRNDLARLEPTGKEPRYLSLLPTHDRAA